MRAFLTSVKPAWAVERMLMHKPKTGRRNIERSYTLGVRVGGGLCSLCHPLLLL